MGTQQAFGLKWKDPAKHVSILACRFSLASLTAAFCRAPRLRRRPESSLTMPTIKGFMAVSNSDFIDHEGKPFYVAQSTRGFRPMYLSSSAAEQNAEDYQSVERVELTIGENDFFRFQHGELFEYTDYRHYRNALRRWKAASHPRAEIQVMAQTTLVTTTLTFTDDIGSAEETSTDYKPRWICNSITFLER